MTIGRTAGRRLVAVLAAVGLMASACSSATPAAPEAAADASVDAPLGESVPDDAPAAVPTTEAPDERCRETSTRAPALDELLVHLPAEAAPDLIGLSQTVFDCSESVVVLGTGASEAESGEAAELALALEAPVLRQISDGEALAAELRRLRPRQLHVFGDLPIEVLPESVSIRRVRPSTMPSADPPDAMVRRIASPDRLGDPGQLVVVDAGLVAPLVDALPSLAAAGVAVAPFDRTVEADLRTVASFDGDVRLVGELDPTTQWRLDLARSGSELPGGGTEVFPGRRIVALYGSPVTSRLGVLGEQDPEESFRRLQPLVAEYSTEDTIVVVPSFEIIVTVADGAPGRDGDYSAELAVDRVRPWVDYAADRGIFVVLDLQPGRAGFLEQARQYEELLRLPHVGLALDPEWRLGPGELPLQRIGSVRADEVNAVVDYLTELVREDALPQKLLVVHQFLRRMVPDRENIRTPEEVAVVIHVDGQGSLASKRRTYTSVTTDEISPDQTLWWGWKNFYDEDFPVATAEQVNEVDPWPVVITFQ